MKLIDTQKIPARYGFTITRLIIDHPDEGRVLLTQCYGGEDTLHGGAVRWEHGSAFKLLPSDTFDSLESLPDHNECTTALEAIVDSLSIERPQLPWDGARVARFAHVVTRPRKPRKPRAKFEYLSCRRVQLTQPNGSVRVFCLPHTSTGRGYVREGSNAGPQVCELLGGRGETLYCHEDDLMETIKQEWRKYKRSCDFNNEDY